MPNCFSGLASTMRRAPLATALVLMALPACAYSGTPEHEVWSFLILIVSVPATVLFIGLYLASKLRWLSWAIVICALISVAAFLVFHADKGLTAIGIMLVVAVAALILNWRKNQKENDAWRLRMEEEASEQRERDGSM